jgi:hypothetical protein
MGQAGFEVGDGLLALPKRAGSSADQSPRKAAEQRIGARALSSFAMASDPATRFSKGICRRRRPHGRLQRAKQHAPFGLRVGEPAEVLVALPLLMGGDELLHGRQDEDGVGVGVCRGFQQRRERTRLSHWGGGAGGWRDVGARGEHERADEGAAQRATKRVTGRGSVAGGHGVLLVGFLLSGQ